MINKARALPAKLKGAAEKIGHTKGFHPLHTPIWADEDKIMAFYLEAERLTQMTRKRAIMWITSSL